MEEKMEGKMEEKKNMSEENQESVTYPVAELEILPEKVICPECGGLTTEGLIFCERCGGELEPMEPEEYERLRKEYSVHTEKQKNAKK